MNKCDKYFNLNLVWIEAQFHDRGVGVTYKIVDFDSLNRDGKVFENGIKKHGIPSKINPWCNRELKKEPMQKFCDDIFGAKNYSIAVGIRIDEIDRVSKDYKNNNIFYPLIENKISTKERNKFWSEQPIQITIPAYKGNCDLCFKKSKRKLLTIIKHEEEIVEWWKEMIVKYGKIEKPFSKSYNDILKARGEMTFFREYMTIDDLVKMAKQPFREFSDEYIYESDLFDQEDDCGSSCQAF
jgi:3'-phosphoadenosine 5'-phosphosulfate sulfotransferase (PAPS reductase)/FAD synthetase